MDTASSRLRSTLMPVVSLRITRTSAPDGPSASVRLRRIPAASILALLLLTPGTSISQTGWFPFTIPWDDSSKTATDASDLLVDFPGQDPATVIDSRGYLRVGGDGHFYFQRTGRRCRFFGVNLTFNANFPPSPDAPPVSGEYPDDRVSDKLARHLAKLGVNVVRFHHMDYYAAPNGIWDPGHFPNDTQHLDPTQLRRLDYLIYQLRRNGIYANLNLKVARHFGPGDGIDDSQSFRDNLYFFQGVSHFNPRMIELHKAYARELLAHRNPHTGLTYAEDPAVAFVEIANEDSMFGNLLNDGGLNYLPAVAGSLPERYSRELDSLWNGWLQRKYPTRSALESAWRTPGDPVDTSDRVRNGDFESGMSQWTVQQLENARATARVEAGAGPDGSAALRVDVTSDGTDWHVQAYQGGHAIVADRTYEVKFQARAAASATIRLDVMKGASPWQNYGMSRSAQLTTAWQVFVYRFKANETDSSTVRPTFELGTQSTTIWIDKVEMRESTPRGLAAGEDPAAGSVERPMRSELGDYSDGRITDLFRFYSGIDEAYFTGMYRTIKSESGSHAMVTGTAPWWGFLGDTAVQSKLDYVDAHYYWDHPSWVGVPSWSPTGWRINNTPWVNSLTDFAGVASQAVEGKPFTLSEFNHVFPNRYALEGPLLASMIANLQDWDGVYMFDYAGNTAAFDDAFTTSFFSMAGNPVKSAQLPIAARIFLGRQNSAAPELLPVELNRDELALAYARGLENARRFLAGKGLPEDTYFRRRLRVRTFDRPEPASTGFSVPPGDLLAGGGELLWRRSAPATSSVEVRGTGVQGGVGFLKGKVRNLGDWEFEVTGDSPDHLAVILQSRDGVALSESNRMLLTVWTEHQNTDMVWNSSRNSVENQWGHAPTLLRPARVSVRFMFSGARSTRIFPLDSSGNRKAALAPSSSNGVVSCDLDTRRDETVWYEIELNEPTTSIDFSTSGARPQQVFSSAAATELQVGWAEIVNRTGSPLEVTSLIEYVSRGTLTSSVRLPASSGTVLSRSPVIRNSTTDTAVAILNRRAASNSITMRLLGSDGTQTGAERVETLGAGEARAFFVREKFSVAEGFEGLLELRSPDPFHTVSLRSLVNPAGDFALTPYPSPSGTAGPAYFPHLVADAAYGTDILCWNPGTAAISSRLEFFSSAGTPAPAGPHGPATDFVLQPGQSRRFAIPPTVATAFYGYAKLTPLSGAALPSATAVITRMEGGLAVSEAAVPPSPESRAERLTIVERPGQKTGLAVLNPSREAVTVELEATDGASPLSPPAKASITLLPGEKRALFLYQIFADFPQYLTGVLQLQSKSGFATLALLGLTNERGDFLLTSLTGEPGLGALVQGETAVVPRIAAGAGYRTILLLTPADPGGSTGRVRFFDSLGAALPLLVR